MPAAGCCVLSLGNRVGEVKAAAAAATALAVAGEAAGESVLRRGGCLLLRCLWGICTAGSPARRAGWAITGGGDLGRVRSRKCLAFSASPLGLYGAFGERRAKCVR